MATVSVNVVNRAPTAQADAVTAFAGTPVTINVLANDSDPDGHTVSIANFGQGSNGSVALVSGKLRYTPGAGFSGSDSFTYTISDGLGETSTATVAVNVQSIVGGRLVINGSSANDYVSMTGVGNGMTGQYVVVINQGTQTVSGITGDIEVDLLDGDDEFVIDNAFVNGTMTINTGAGNDVAELGLQKIVSTRLDLNVSFGDGNDRLDGKRLYIGGNQTVNGGAGDDSISLLGAALPGVFILGTSSGRATTITGDAGNDTIQVSYTFIVGQWQVHGGAGDDTINVRTSACNGNVYVNGDAGADTLVVDTNFLVATLWLGGGSEADRLELKNSLGLIGATIDGNSGNDTVTVRNLTSQRLTLTLGAQNDTADVRSSLFDQFFANLGEHDDSLTMYGNLVRSITDVDGGHGGDAFYDLSNSHRGGIRRIALERLS